MSDATNPFTRVRELLQELFDGDKALNSLVDSVFLNKEDANEEGTKVDKDRPTRSWLTVDLPEGPIDGFESNQSWQFTRRFTITGALPEGELDPKALEDIELRVWQLVLSAQQDQLGQAGVISVAPKRGGYLNGLLENQLSDEDDVADHVFLAFDAEVEVVFDLTHTELTTGAFSS